MELLAYSKLNLKPDELLGLTMKEFYGLLDGYELRKKEEDMRQAYFVSWLMAPHLGKDSKLSPKDIYDPLHPKTKDDIEREKEEFMKEFDL